MIEKIAYYLKDPSQVPNQVLAKELAESGNLEGIKEIASYLHDPNKKIASDCLKVLYEAAYIKPELIVDYYKDFVHFLNSKNNRMVWGSMIALAQIAKVRPELVINDLRLIENKIASGSVITHVHGVYTLINLARFDPYYPLLKDKLFELQRTCRQIDFPKRAESMIGIVRPEDLHDYMTILKDRLGDLSNAGQKRLNKVLKKYGG